MKALLLPSQVSSPSTPSLSLSSGPMCFLTISTFSCACRYPHPQSSSSLSTFLPASYPTYRRTGTRENAFLALRKDVCSCDVSFFFLFLFFLRADNAQDADVFWRGRGRTQGGELRRSMTSFHPIHEITTSDDHWRISTNCYFIKKLNYFIYESIRRSDSKLSSLYLFSFSIVLRRNCERDLKTIQNILISTFSLSLFLL